jgi:hypothetical protein
VNVKNILVRSMFVLLAVCLGTFIVVKMINSKGANPAPPPQAATSADSTWTIRGRVTSLPLPPTLSLIIHHEAIPGFTDAQGTVIGMEEMEMSFPFLAPGVLLDGINVGDPVEATMEMRWTAEPRFLITAVRRLPADTQLKIGTIETEPGK